MNDFDSSVWQDNGHAKIFDCWSGYRNKGLKKIYESFNDIKIFFELKLLLQGRNFIEIGCATGELYRYLSAFHNELNYFGIDVSKPAIERARTKYPNGDFFVSDANIMPSEVIKSLKLKPDVLFSRDVVVHQAKPFEFLKDLISIPAELIILRLRTKDKGDTVLDPKLSCQYYCGQWVPYMIFNIDELILFISKNVIFESLHIYKKYTILGGNYGRYLPKDCYYSQTGTSETAIGIKVANKPVNNAEVIIKQIEESSPKLNMSDIKLGLLISKIKEKI